ncbi:MAG TPA: hypothetical protein PLZ29_07535 [Spirochaetota bacterium]|jgi:hypothetical protein|nr:hypothetical protein [Spirochaetota bacterium]
MKVSKKLLYQKKGEPLLACFKAKNASENSIINLTHGYFPSQGKGNIVSRK